MTGSLPKDAGRDGGCRALEAAASGQAVLEVTGFKPAISTMRKSSEAFPPKDAEQPSGEKTQAKGQISLWDTDRW